MSDINGHGISTLQQIEALHEAMISVKLSQQGQSHQSVTCSHAHPDSVTMTKPHTCCRHSVISSSRTVLERRPAAGLTEVQEAI